MTDTPPPPLPTSPPDPPEPRWSFVIALLTMVATITILDLFFRTTALDAKIRKSHYITAKGLELATVNADVIVTGDSRMFHGVIPAVMNDTLKEDTGGVFETYNFGIPAGTTPIFMMAAHEAVLHRPKPRVFVIGVTPALMSCCDDLVRLSAAPGIRPSTIPALVRATWWNQPEDAGAAIFLGLFRLQQVRSDVLFAYLNFTAPPPLRFESMGWNTMGGRVDPDAQNARAVGRATGYANLMDKSKGAFIHPAAVSYLRSAIRDLQNAGIKVAIIGTPQARQLDVYHDAKHTYFEYLDALKQIAAEAGIPFVDCNTFPGLENADFIDGDHLAQDGARKFTQYLAHTVVAPLLR